MTKNMYIKKYKKFLEDLDISGTYLTKKEKNPNKYSPFFGAQSTADKNWGLEFSQVKIFHRVTFPDGFEKYFAPKGTDPDKWLLEESDLKTDDGKIMTNQEKYKIFLDEIDFLYREQNPNSYNRIHFPEGIPHELTGIGLGYIIYEEFIKYLGYGSSRSDASFEAKPVWSKIANDPDFWIIMFRGFIFAGYKKAKNLEEVKEKMYDLIQKKLDLSEIDFDQETSHLPNGEIEMIKWLEKNIVGFKISPEILEDVPEIKNLIKNKIEITFPQKRTF